MAFRLTVLSNAHNRLCSLNSHGEPRMISETTPPKALPREEIWPGGSLGLSTHAPGGSRRSPGLARGRPHSGRSCPRMPEHEAKVETHNAIAYATREHTEWFWRGIGEQR